MATYLKTPQIISNLKQRDIDINNLTPEQYRKLSTILVKPPTVASQTQYHGDGQNYINLVDALQSGNAGKINFTDLEKMLDSRFGRLSNETSKPKLGEENNPITLPEVVVQPQTEVNWADINNNLLPQKTQPYDPQKWFYEGIEWMKENPLQAAKQATSFVPIIGEVMDGYDIYTDLKDQNYPEAAIGLGAMFLPELVEKGIKKGYRAFNNWRLSKELDKSIPSDIDIHFEHNPKIIQAPTYNPPRTKLYFSQRPKSKISESERIGIPKSERNQPENPSLNIRKEHTLYHGDPPSAFYDGVLIQDLFPNQLAKESFRVSPQNEYTAPYNDWLWNTDGSVDELREYISGLPNEDMIDIATIRDYRTYLSRVGINPYTLSDQEISNLISAQYKALSEQMNGKLKGVVMYHGSSVPVEQFDFQTNTGKGMGNMGAFGPANYFSSARNNYGQIGFYDDVSGKNIVLGDMQPYLINNINSTPISATLQRKSILPNYKSPPNGAVAARDAQNLLIRHEHGYQELTEQQLQDLKSIVSNYYDSLEYKTYLAQNVLPYTNERDMFIVDSDALGYNLRLGQTINPLLNGHKIDGIEGGVPRNTGIKSLFFHPSLLKRNEFGKLEVIRDWNDPRVNYKQGGKLNKRFK